MSDGTYADELKPCPFCGSKNLLYCGHTIRAVGHFQYIDCMNCGGRGPDAKGWRWTKAKWNKRPTVRRPAE